MAPKVSVLKRHCDTGFPIGQFTKYLKRHEEQVITGVTEGKGCKGGKGQKGDIRGNVRSEGWQRSHADLDGGRLSSVPPIDYDRASLDHNISDVISQVIGPQFLHHVDNINGQTPSEPVPFQSCYVRLLAAGTITVFLYSKTTRDSWSEIEVVIDGAASPAVCPAHGCPIFVQFGHGTGSKFSIIIYGDDCKTKPVTDVVDIREVDYIRRKCPTCYSQVSLNLDLGKSGNYENDQFSLASSQQKRGTGGAFVTVLWGTSEQHVLDALNLGFSLKKYNTRYDCVLLATSDVLELSATALLSLYWDVKLIDHVPVHSTLLSKCRDRLSGVFTKLRAWEQTEYAKIVLLDGDLLVTRNVDELLQLPTPTAYMRGHKSPEPGKRRDESTLTNETGQIVYGINAGVIVLTPENADNILQHVANPSPSHMATTGPEQDFLSRYFSGEWQEGLHMKFNYQLHQLIHSTQAKQKKSTDRQNISIDQVAIFHYSSEYTAAAYFLQDGLPDFQTFLDSFFKAFCGVWDEDVRRRISWGMQKWIKSFEEMYRDVIQRVSCYSGPVDERACPLCQREFKYVLWDDVNHCFFDCACKSVKDALDDWRDKLRLPFAKAQDLLGNVKPGKAWPCLSFAGHVLLARMHEGGGIVPAWRSAAMDLCCGSCTDIMSYQVTPRQLQHLPSVVREARQQDQDKLGMFLVDEAIYTDEIFQEMTLDTDAYRSLLDKALHQLPSAVYMYLKKRMAAQRACIFSSSIV